MTCEEILKEIEEIENGTTAFWDDKFKIRYLEKLLLEVSPEQIDLQLRVVKVLVEARTNGKF